MATGRADQPRRRWLDALFGEAWELGRRRRRRYLLVALACCAVAVGGALMFRGGGGNGGGSAVGSHVRISSTALPAGGHYVELTAAGGRLVVTGGQPYDVISQKGGDGLMGGRVTGRCTALTLDPASLRVISRAAGNCGNPSLYGERVLPIRYGSTREPTDGVITLQLRIAVVAHARDGYHLGPIVLRYPECSDCGVEWIYGDGSLWVYGPLATSLFGNGKPLVDNQGALLRISERTGRVLERWRMPVFTRALLAVDKDGVWIAQSLFGGEPEHVSAAQRVDYRSLFRVAPGMRTPARVFDLRTWGANWLVAADHRVWLDVAYDNRPSRLWSFQGASATPVLRSRVLSSGSVCLQMGEGETTIAGSATAGIYCVGSGRLRLRSFDPATGAARALPDPGFEGGPAVDLGRSVFFLPPSPTGWAARVYRVTPT